MNSIIILPFLRDFNAKLPSWIESNHMEITTYIVHENGLKRCGTIMGTLFPRESDGDDFCA